MVLEALIRCTLGGIWFITAYPVIAGWASFICDDSNDSSTNSELRIIHLFLASFAWRYLYDVQRDIAPGIASKILRCINANEENDEDSPEFTSVLAQYTDMVRGVEENFVSDYQENEHDTDYEAQNLQGAEVSSAYLVEQNR